MRLGKEFDLANTARPQLHIRRDGLEIGAPYFAVDHPLDGLDVANRPIVEITAPDKRLQDFQETVRTRMVSGGRTRLDPDHPLPVLTHTLIVKVRHLR